MKLLCLLITTSMLATSTASELTPKAKKAFVDHFRSWSDLKKEFPNDLEVQVLFVDLTSDGKPEALATSRGTSYQTGSDWTVFVKKDGAWRPLGGIDPHSKKARPVFAMFARSDEFHLIENEKGEKTLTVIHKDYDKLAEEGKAPAKVTKLLFNKDGFLQEEAVQSLDAMIAYASDFKKVERLKIERFKD